MRKFREIMENRIKKVEEGSVKVIMVEGETQITEKADLNINPIEKLREKGYILKTNVPSKNGRELTFFKTSQAEEAYEYLVQIGYDKKFKIGQAGKIVSISNLR